MAIGLEAQWALCRKWCGSHLASHLSLDPWSSSSGHCRRCLEDMKMDKMWWGWQTCVYYIATIPQHSPQGYSHLQCTCKCPIQLLCYLTLPTLQLPRLQNARKCMDISMMRGQSRKGNHNEEWTLFLSLDKIWRSKNPPFPLRNPQKTNRKPELQEQQIPSLKEFYSQLI